MEIFFIDMLQLDPVSGRERSVRRQGPETAFGWLQRHWGLLSHAVLDQKLQRETCAAYKQRQQEMEQRQLDYKLSNPYINSKMVAPEEFRQGLSWRRSMRSRCSWLVQRLWFNILMKLVTLANIVWLFYLAEYYKDTHLYKRPTYSAATDVLFLCVFSIELIVRGAAFNKLKDCFQSSWFMFDAAVVSLTFAEIVPVSALTYNTLNVDVIHWVNLVMRGTRLLRVERLFRMFPSARTIARAIWSGIHEALMILLLMTVTLFCASIMLRTGVVKQEVRETYFSTNFYSFETLVVQGLFFDGIQDYLADCHKTDPDGVFEWYGYFGMLTWVMVGQYGFLNMLIGLFASTAATFNEQESARQDVAYLETHLASILECYLTDSDIMREAPGARTNNSGLFGRATDYTELDNCELGVTEFDLILKNLDAIEVLENCGTDVESLKNMRHILFPGKTSRIRFGDLYGVILQLRKGKPAPITDLIQLRELVRSRTDHLKELLTDGCPTTSVPGWQTGSFASS
jgi:hypothetical protein